MSNHLPSDPLEFLELLRTLEDNWDGYKANKIDSRIIDICKELVPLLRKDFAIAPIANGVVDFSWETDAGHACLEVGITRYSMYIHNPGRTTTSVGPSNDLKRYVSAYMKTIGERLYGDPPSPILEAADDDEEDSTFS